MQTFLELQFFSDFDSLITLGIWHGELAKPLNQINKDFFISLEGNLKDYIVTSSNDNSMEVVYKGYGEIKKGNITFKGDTFRLPYGFPSIDKEYIKYIENLGFEKIKTKNIALNCD